MVDRNEDNGRIKSEQKHENKLNDEQENTKNKCCRLPHVTWEKCVCVQ